MHGVVGKARRGSTVGFGHSQNDCECSYSLFLSPLPTKFLASQKILQQDSRVKKQDMLKNSDFGNDCIDLLNQNPLA